MAASCVWRHTCILIYKETCTQGDVKAIKIDLSGLPHGNFYIFGIKQKIFQEQHKENINRSDY